MAELKIFSSMVYDGEALRILQEATAPHRLIFPTRAIGSVLDKPQADPAMNEADIALGQPPVDGVLAAERLKWVHITSAGFTRYDTPEFRAAVKARGLIVTNSSQVYAEACAEHVFAFMMAQARQIPAGLVTRCSNTSPEWAQLRNASRNLRGESVVVLGYGAIAARLVAMLAPFEMKIVAMRREPKGDEGVRVIQPDELRAALADADHVVDILPDNAASHQFINAKRIGWMKTGAIFYNIGRGTTVDQPALIDALRNGKLGAAWLDVTEPEPVPDGHPLLTTPNCFLTPHLAGGHRNETLTLVRHFTDNFRRYLAGEALVDRIM